MESNQQNQIKNDEIIKLKIKNAEENQKNEELNEYIMPLQNNMMTSVEGLNEPSNKVIIKKLKYFHFFNVYSLNVF